jgi:hypothetical protein
MLLLVGTGIATSDKKTEENIMMHTFTTFFVQ